MLAARLLSVTNPCEGVLLARFSRAMDSAALTEPERWTLTGAAGDPPSKVLAIATQPSYPERATLRYAASALDLDVAFSGNAADGTPLDPAFSSFHILLAYPTAPPPTIRLFETGTGTLGVTQRPLQRRSVEDLVRSRAIANAVRAQLAARAAAIAGAK